MTGDKKNITHHPIDVVISWVDGSDPELAAKRNRYITDGQSTGLSSGAHSTRFASLNEIRYCVLSIMKFAPFVRNIFIITDGQDPDLYNDIKTYFPERLESYRVVDHKEIFRGFENFLPSFNSISIGNMIWRIKGLSENFVYFNDDTFLVREIQARDWFIDNKPVLRGRWVPSPLARILWYGIRAFINKYLAGKKDYTPRASFHMGQWNAASLLGYKWRYFTNSHTPHAVGRSIVEEYFNEHRQVLEKNISCRFRKPEQFTFIALSNHLQLQAGNRQTAGPGLVYMKAYNRPANYIDKKIKLCENNSDIRFLCVQSLDLCEKEKQEKLLGWMEALLQL
ncbi:MAG: Stealth CR1 domain-containing protein [Bacteroidales bacterium]|nr:Stealth CR1 domain-containing protein [Bacteroidales bacterium]